MTDDLRAFVRLTTGSSSDPLSSNQTMGEYWNRYAVFFDRAYLQYDPVEWLRVMGGRMPNPWLYTDLMWAPDLGFGGFAVTFKPQLTPATRLILTAGAFPLQEVQLSQSDKWLYAGQLGGEWEPSSATKLRLAAGYFDYNNLVGEQNPPGSSQFDFTAPQFLQKGNTLFNISSDPARPLLALASDYRLVQLFGELNLQAFEDKRFVLTGDYVRNVGWSGSEVATRVGTNVDRETTGWLLRASLGTPELRMRHDWLVSLGYKYVQRDATVDAFVDSDFQLGGTNAKGFILGAAYGLDRNFWVSARWLSSDQISGPPLGIDVFQLDLNARS